MKDRKQLEKQLDILWAQKVKERAKGKCELNCRNNQSILHAHHIFSRKHKSTRWDLNNGIALCPACHLYLAHKSPTEFTFRLLDIKGRDFLDRLRIKANSVGRWSVGELEILKQELENLSKVC